MGVCNLFFLGGQNCPRMGGNTFSQKSLKVDFLPAKGEKDLFCHPRGSSWPEISKEVLSSKNV